MTEVTPATDPDWPKRVTDKIVDVVDQTRTKTTRPAIAASRGIVFGLVVLVLALAAVTLLLVGLFRLTVMITHELGSDEVYWAYFIWGGILTLLGAFLWTKRTS